MKKYRKKRYRNEIRVNSNRKRIISLAMVWVLCLILLPASAFAAEDSGAAIGTGGLCAHHTEHDDTCGYVEGIAESPCTHEHSEDCYTEVTSCTHEHTRECYPSEDSSIPEGGTTSSEDESVADTMSSDNKSVEDTMPSDDESGKDTTLPEAADPTQCSHVCSVESGCIKQELSCKHEHNEECGYAPAVEGQPCTYVCALCGMTEITAWSWVDTQDAIDPDANVLALAGVSEESPALYGDIVALLPAEITATTEDGEVTIALGGWTCPDYPEAGAYTGSYTLTASLPEGYVLAADAPALTVTVEFGGVALLMDTTHADHPICGASCTDNKHGRTTFTYWLANDYGTGSSLVLLVGGGDHSTFGDTLETSGNAWTLPEGKYYLADDIRIDKPIEIKGDVTICLNGHDISVGKDVFAFEIWQYNNAKKGTLTLTDCKENCGEVKSYDTAERALGGVDIISNKCTFNMYGGKISGCKRGVFVNSYGTFNMRGGVISDSVGGNGVTVFDSNATFNMYGGEISHNTDYGVDIWKGATFNMYDGVIKDNPSKIGHIGVWCQGGTFNMSGGEISSCTRGVHVTCTDDSSRSVDGKFVMSDGTITGNEIGVSLFTRYDGKGSSTQNIIQSSKFTMTGGEIINNTKIGVDMGYNIHDSTFRAGGKLTVGGTARIQDNSNKNASSYGNVYFRYGEIKLTSSPALTEGAYIGITTPDSTLPTEENPLLIATGYSENEITDYFHSDRDGYVIVCTNTDDPHNTHTLKLTVSPHTHNWKYTKADESTISVACNGAGTCAYKTTLATMSIRTAQTEYDYKTITEAPKAMLTYSNNWPKDVAKAQESAIEYYKRKEDGINYDRVLDNKDLTKPGKYLAQVEYLPGKYLVTHFSVVDNRKQDPNYAPPTAKTGLTYNGRAQALINQGSTTGGTMQYKLDTGEYSTTIPTATDAGTYTVYYKVVGNATYNDTIEQSITVTIKQAALTGTPTFTPVTEAGKTIADVTLTAPTRWPEGTFYWMNGEIGLSKATPITQGTSYEWVFIPADINYKSIGGNIVLWADTSGGGSNPGGSGSGGGSSSSTGGSNSGDSSGDGSSSSTGDGSSDTGNSNNGSSNANIPPTPVTVPVSGDEKTIQVDAVVSGTTATIKNIDLPKLDTVIEDTAKNGVVTIDFSVLKKVDTVKLPSNVVKQIAEAVNDPADDAKSLEIVLTNGTSVKLDAKVLDEKNVQANEADITLCIKRITDRSLNIKQKLTVGNRPALDINVSIGGKPISNMSGKVTVSASYELKPGEQASGIVVYYVDANGNRKLCETSYDPISKRVSWKTSQLSPSSVYMIGYDESRVKPGTGSYVNYTVQKGNTLSMIAKKHGCTVAEILAANSGLIKNPNRIYVGWQLKIPQD
mgnify:CR=1 FL=1